MQKVNLGTRGMKFGYVEGEIENLRHKFGFYLGGYFEENFTCIAGV